MGLLNFLFNKVLVYTAIGNDQYFKAAQSFQREGLHYKVKSNSGNRPAIGQQYILNDTSTTAIYDFYVKKEDQQKAQNVLSKLRSS
ncbi:hypothetical protein ACFVHQ_01780 [Actinomycetes bacterium NPDC127524]